MSEPSAYIKIIGTLTVPVRSRISGAKSPEQKRSFYLPIQRDVARARGLQDGDLVTIQIIGIEKAKEESSKNTDNENSALGEELLSDVSKEA